MCLGKEVRRHIFRHTNFRVQEDVPLLELQWSTSHDRMAKALFLVTSYLHTGT